MKKILVLVVMGIVLMVNGVGYGQNLLTNGGFENGLNDWIGWVDHGNETKPTIDTTLFSTGLQSLKLSVPIKGIVGASYNQKLEFGGVYKLTAKVFVKSGSPWIYYRIHRERKHIRDISAYADITKVNIWQTVTLTFPHISTGTEFVILRLDGIGEANFDDVTLELVDTVATITNYQNILADLNSKPELKTEANQFFADLYQYVEKDFVKAEPYLIALDTINDLERLGDLRLELGKHLEAKDAYVKANGRAIIAGDKASITRIGQKIEGVNLAIGQK